MEISDSDDSVTREVSQEPPVVTETKSLLDNGGDSSAHYLTTMNATATFRLYSAVTRQRGISFDDNEVQLELCAHLYEAVREVITANWLDQTLTGQTGQAALRALERAFTLAHALGDGAGREGLATIWNLAANYDQDVLFELVDNMAKYYVEGITEPIEEWLFKPTQIQSCGANSHDNPIDLTSADPDGSDETGKVGAVGISAAEMPFLYTTNDVVAKQLKAHISQGLVKIEGESEPTNKGGTHSPSRPALHMLHDYHAYLTQDPDPCLKDTIDVQAMIKELFDKALQETIQPHFEDGPSMTAVTMPAYHRLSDSASLVYSTHVRSLPVWSGFNTAVSAFRDAFSFSICVVLDVLSSISSLLASILHCPPICRSHSPSS